MRPLVRAAVAVAGVYAVLHAAHALRTRHKAGWDDQ